MRLNNNQLVFLKLLRAGLWEDIKVNGDGLMVNDLPLTFSDSIDWEEVHKIAEEQSVIGLVAAGIGHVADVKVPKLNALTFVGDTLLLEQRNQAMNEFVAWLMELLQKENIYAILMKGQGIAQCYKRPLWRTCGDVDLLLSEDNYEKAKKLLIPMALDVEQEYKSFKHLGMTMQGGFIVELHGTMHSRLSSRVDRVIDETQRDMFLKRKVRSVNFNANHNANINLYGTKVGSTSVQVHLPAPDEDVIFVFTHIMHHFYIEGIGLRQICDWCRLLWTYRASLDCELLESRIRQMRLMTEWKAFYNLASRYLGMPDCGSGLMVYDSRFDKKADKILEFVMEVGNFGHNRQAASGKISSAWYKMRDFARHSLLFPWDSVKFFWHFLWNGVGLTLTKERP